MRLYFTDVFGVSDEAIEDYGAFNISLVTDLPLFIDPFLLFNSHKSEYQTLHERMIQYLCFLRDKSAEGSVGADSLNAWYRFSEVKQNWLGFCLSGNTGRGLGGDFASALNMSLVHIFSGFGKETVTKASHLEKLVLIRSGVGKDMISDFTTNLIKDYLLRYTETFAKKNIAPELRRLVAVSKAVFSYKTETWTPRQYNLPFHNGQFVLLTPKDILTRDDTWINRPDLIRNFEDIPAAIDNDALRAQINNYFYRQLSGSQKPTKDDHAKAVQATIRAYPQLIDYFIKYKEDHGEEAKTASEAKVIDSHVLYVKQFGAFIDLLSQSQFYQCAGRTLDEVQRRIAFFKDVIENKGGYKFFYVKGKPIQRENDVHILFRFVWFATPSDVSREVNDGQGPADFKISRGRFDKTLVEFKLAKNTHLRRNLEKQVEVYKKASDAQHSYEVILYFSDQELGRVQTVLKDLGLQDNKYVVLVDARNDNKPSGSKA
jgi:hypothetical protein